MEQFSCKTKILSGAGTVSELKNMGIRRLFLVTDPYFAQNGTAARLAALSGAQQTEIFHRVQPDPSVELVAEGVSVVKAFQPDTIVALGGGSAIDCAKGVAYFSGLAPRLVAIPTTSGSGSEVTDFTVLTHGGVKHPLADAKILPDVAILDSDLLESIPPSLVADAGFDVLAHGLEAFVATGAGPITDALAKEAFSVAYSALPASFSGNTAVRLKLHTAATMAGLAFHQAGLGLCHAMAHMLGGMFHLPHGRLNAILLPWVVECNAHSAGSKYAFLARSAGLGGSADTVAVRNLKNALIRLRRELKLPQTLQEAGVDPQQVRYRTKDIVNGVLADPCCQTNPIEVKDFMIRRILDRI